MRDRGKYYSLSEAENSLACYNDFTIDCEKLIGTSKGDVGEFGSLGSNMPELFKV